MINYPFKFKQSRLLDAWGIVSLILFFLLAIAIKFKDPALERWDQTVSIFFYQHRSNALHSFLQLISNIGRPEVTIVLMLIVAVFFYLKHLKLLSLWLGLTTLAGNLLWELLKLCFRRPRPLLTAIHNSYSFPSGHAASVVIFAALIISLLPLWHLSIRSRWLLIAATLSFVLLIAFSRIYLQAHYVTDVLAGASLSFGWVVFMRNIYNKFAEKLLSIKMFQ